MSSLLMDPPPRSARLPGRPPEPERAQVSLTIDGRAVTVPSGTTLLAACRSLDIDVPTLCFLETLKPVNACRLCVVEVAGARTLAAACSRAVEPGMQVQTESERVRHSRKMVLEFLGSSVDLSTAPQLTALAKVVCASVPQASPHL